MESIDVSDDPTNLARIGRDIQTCVSNQELPILFDDGGLLDEDGHFTTSVSSILSILPDQTDTYLFIVSSRRPNQTISAPLPIVGISPLKSEDIKSLVGALARRQKLKLTTSDISELSDYIGGFPPACSYAIHLALDYGVRLILDNKHRLVEFRRTQFVKYLTESKLTDGEFEILRILAEYSPLPLSVLGAAVKQQPEQLAGLLTRLIDYSLVVPEDYGFYSIADPIKDAVVKLSRTIMINDEHRAVALGLKQVLETGDLEEHAIDVYRVLFRAASNSGDRALAADALYLANDVIQLLERSYHARDYEQAITLAREAVSMRSTSATARSFLIRALIQEARWPEAEQALKEYGLVAPQRNTHFLSGFLKRKKGDIKGAIQSFHEAEKAGRTSSNLKRELAWCYATIGDIRLYWR